MAVKERLRRWHAGEAAVLWAEAARATNPQVRRGRRRGNMTEETEEQERVRRNAERALTKAGEGQMTRAIQALTSVIGNQSCSRLNTRA